MGSISPCFQDENSKNQIVSKKLAKKRAAFPLFSSKKLQQIEFLKKNLWG